MTTGPIPYSEWQTLELSSLDVAVFWRYYRGHATPADTAQLDAWCAAKPGRRDWCNQFWHGLTALEHADDLSSDEVMRRTSAVIRAIESSAAGTGRPSVMPRPHWWRRPAQVAIGLAAAAVIGVVGYRALPSLLARPHHVMPTRTYATTTGQVATVRLHDGTDVTLAPRSELRVPQFGSSSRTVELTGEAHFNVAHASGAPFIVRVGATSARVLGTAFTVRHYPNAPRVIVAVSEGKVALSVNSSRRPSVTLTAGIAGIASDSEIVTTTVVDGMQYAGWMRGYLIFRKAPVSEVLQSLSRWYGYEFRLADSTMANQSVTAAISTQSSAAALSTLKLVLEADLSFDGDVITVRAKRANARSLQDRRLRPAAHESSIQVGR